MNDPSPQVQMLGELTVSADGRPLTISGSRKTRALLAYLLLQDRPVTREHLCELLWPHPDDPRAALRWSLTKLRPTLDAVGARLATDRTSVAVDGLAERIDHTAEHCVTDGHREDAAGRLDGLAFFDVVDVTQDDGADGVFVGSGIFKSGNPAQRAEAIVKATTFHDDPAMVAKVSRGLGEAMVGINVEELPAPHRLSERGW